MVTIGILVSQLINYGTERFFWGWRVSLGIAVVPALILFIGAPQTLATQCSCAVQACRLQDRSTLITLSLHGLRGTCRCRDRRRQRQHCSGQQHVVKQPLRPTACFCRRAHSAMT